MLVALCLNCHKYFFLNFTTGDFKKKTKKNRIFEKYDSEINIKQFWNPLAKGYGLLRRTLIYN